MWCALILHRDRWQINPSFHPESETDKEDEWYQVTKEEFVRTDQSYGFS